MEPRDESERPSRRRQPNMAQAGLDAGASDVTILGAGVIGMAGAYALARRGHKVTVIDGADGPAMDGASCGNGAQLSYAYSDALASPSVLRNLHRYLLGRDEAFRWRLAASPGFALWNLRFMRHCLRPSFERNTLSNLVLALESRRALAGLLARHPIDFDHRKSGKLLIHASAQSLEQARHVGAFKTALGVEQHVLDARQAIEKEPALADYGGAFVGAIWSPDDELGDPVKFCRGLRSILETGYGVDFLFRTRVEGLRRAGGRIVAISTSQGEMPARNVVLSLGTGSVRVARTVGVRLPIWPMQGYSLTVPVGPAAPDVSVTDTKRKLVLCRIGDRLRVAGLADLGPADAAFDADRAATLAQAVRQVFPKAGQYVGEQNLWTGYRPLTPSSQPLIGPSAVEGLFLNCGHGGLGWTLAMGSAQKLAGLIADRA